MKKSELKQIIKESLISILKEKNDEESGMSKSAHSSLGLKQIRVVIDGGTTAENQAKIIAIVKKHDPKAKVEFYKATGKIVGVMAKAKMDGIKRDLKQIDDKISAKEKLQSLKENVDMQELEQELKRKKKENPGKKVTYFFTKDNVEKNEKIYVNFIFKLKFILTLF